MKVTSPATAPLGSELRHASLRDLVADHVLMRRCFDIIEDTAEKAGHGEESLLLLEELLAFVDEFIDGVHHVKEDAIVYDEILRSRPELSVWLEGVHDEHEEGWCHAEGMRMALRDRRPGWCTAWLWNAQGLIRTIRAHIAREEAEIFPRLDEVIDEEIDALIATRVERQFRDLEGRRRAWADRLAALSRD
jgi:hemerythrin-like domain-containing protein